MNKTQDSDGAKSARRQATHECQATCSISALDTTLREDIEALDKMINDLDSCCVARHLRIERRNALQYVMGLLENLEGWNFTI